MSRTRLVLEVLRVARLRRGRFALAVALGAGTVLAALSLLGVSAYLICRASEQPPILSLTTTIVVVRALALVSPLARYGDRLVSHDLAFRGLGRLRVAIFEQIEPLAPGELDIYRDGDLLDRTVRDVDEIQDLVLRVGLPAIVAAVVAPVVVVALGVVLPVAGLCVLAGLVFAAVTSPAIARRLTRRAQERQSERRSTLTAELVEALDAADELWLCGADDAVLARVASVDRELVAAARADARGAGWAEAIVILTAGLTSISVLALASAAASAGDLDPLLVASLALVAGAVFEIVHPLTSGARAIDSVIDSARRVLELMALRPAVEDPACPAPVPDEQLGIDAVDLSVSRGSGDDRALVVDGVDLHLSPGGRVLVTGPSGAGKSTVLLVLARFLERDGGRVDVGGRDVRDYDQDDLRRRVLLVDQDAHVFDSTVRENLLLARPGASDDELHLALEAAQLDAFVTSLPHGLDTSVGINGRTLSGGQRQRLALARAFLSEADVLLVDEPTAHLDPPTASRLLTDLDAHLDGRAVVLVTHRDAGPFADAPTVEIEPVGRTPRSTDARRDGRARRDDEADF